MKLIFHGAAREVGRSCIEVEGEKRRLLLDCGLKLTQEESEYPIDVKDPANIDAVFISHAHLDHTGGLPRLDHQGMTCPIFTTNTTKNLSRLLLRDAFKIGKITHQHLGYDEGDIKMVLRCMNRVKIDTKGSYADIKYEFFDAGHIPGSASILIELDGKTILYTGDINSTDTRLLKAAEENFPEVDIMICESTYGDREHPNRLKTEKEFLDEVRSAIKAGGVVLVPVFALGRSQEIALLLAKQNFNVPIYFDGMSNAASDIILDDPSSVKSFGELKSAMNKLKRIRKPKDRSDALAGQSIIVTTSGMLTGGPILHYLRHMSNNPENKILITGYQVEGTNGHMLLDTHQVFIDGWRKKVNCAVKQFDFSAHSGLSELKALVRKANPKKVFFVHGDADSTLILQEWADAMGMEAYAPKLGEIINI